MKSMELLRCFCTISTVLDSGMTDAAENASGVIPTPYAAVPKESRYMRKLTESKDFNRSYRIVGHRSD